MDERRQSVECKRGAQTVVLLQTHYLNRALLRMFSELSCAMGWQIRRREAGS